MERLRSLSWRLLIAAALIGATFAGGALARAHRGDVQPLPRSPEHRNMQLIGHNDLAGHGNLGEGYGEVKTRHGRRILDAAHESGPRGLSVLDVTNPRRPKLLRQLDVPDANTRCNSLDVSGRLLVVAYTLRGSGDAETIGINSARRASRRERAAYAATPGTPV